MKPESILKASMLDILFENRNKEYGAYELRMNYEGRLLKSIAGMLGIVLLFICINYWTAGKQIQSGIIDNLLPPETVLEKFEIEKIKPPVISKPPAATIQYATPLFVTNTDAPIPENTALDKDVLIGTQTIEGPPASESTLPSPPENTGNNIAPVPPVPNEPEVYRKAEIMPEYPGGEAAMRRFLQKNLRFDFENMEAGSRVEILCRFIVDQEGNVTGIEIIKSGGVNEFDKEVARVVTKMPQWKPGIQNGRNVSVDFTLPVIVKVPEE
jgi:protein TonB